MTWVEFLKSLKVVATSPYAFVAYIFVLAGWVYVVTSQNRLRAITRLPADEQAAILKKEYNVLPRVGLSGNQWIRARVHLLTFLGIVVEIAAIVILSTIAMLNIPNVFSSSNASPSAQQSEASSPPTKGAEPTDTLEGYKRHDEAEQILGHSADTDIEVYVPPGDSETGPAPVVRIVTDSGKPDEQREFASSRVAKGHAWFYLPFGNYIVNVDRAKKHVERRVKISSPNAHIFIDMSDDSLKTKGRP